MVDAREHHRRGRGEVARPGIDKHSVLTGVDKQAGVRGRDAVGGQVIPAQDVLDVLPRDIAEEGLERVVEGAIADGETLECAQRETIASAFHAPARLSAPTVPVYHVTVTSCQEGNPSPLGL